MGAFGSTQHHPGRSPLEGCSSDIEPTDAITL